MEFQNNNGAAPKEEAAKEINNHAVNGAAKLNGTPARSTNGDGKAENKPSPGKEEKPGKKQEQPKAGEPEKEEPKLETHQPLEEAAPAKPELTLEAKIKAVNDLHRKTIQRLALI